MRKKKYGKGKRQRKETKETKSSASSTSSPGPKRSSDAAEGQAGRIKLLPWWERHPGRLEFELKLLEDNGIDYERREDAWAAGILVLKLCFPVGDGKQIVLEVCFPDIYPYTRFDVIAPDLELEHHQNPFVKNLCLFGQRSENWLPSFTLYGVLAERLEKTVDAGSSDDQQAMASVEEIQAEPISSYFSYPDNAFIVMESDMKIPETSIRGTFKIRLLPEASSVVRGVMWEVTDQDGVTKSTGRPGLEKIWPIEIVGKWVRVEEPIGIDDGDAFLNKLFEQHPSLRKKKLQKASSGFVDVIGVVYPEESEWRKRSDSWMFVLRADSIASGQSPRQPYFARTMRINTSEGLVRVPEVAPLGDKSVAVIGLGAVGWSAAIELARNGIGRLRIVDYDVVDAASTVRWGFGFQAFGKKKGRVIDTFIRENYPFTEVEYVESRLGSGLDGAGKDLGILESVFEDSDLVIDATAEIGIEQLLSDLSQEFHVPYICMSTRPGAWGGAVARFLPESDSGCWYCFRASLEDGSIPPPPNDPSEFVQPAGCSEPTFTGASFDIQEVSLMGVRLTVSTLCSGTNGGYPEIPWDAAILALRDEKGNLLEPKWHTHRIKQRPSCGCQRKAQKSGSQE